MLALVPEINSSTSLQSQLAGEASEWLQCLLNINRPNLQMHSRHLGMPVGRFLLLQPFMETPREQMSTSYWKFYVHGMGWLCQCVSAVNWKGLAFFCLAFPLNHGPFRRGWSNTQRWKRVGALKNEHKNSTFHFHSLVWEHGPACTHHVLHAEAGGQRQVCLSIALYLMSPFPLVSTMFIHAYDGMFLSTPLGSLDEQSPHRSPVGAAV